MIYEIAHEFGRRWPSSDVQTLMFDRDLFSKSQAKKWARQHGYRYGKMHTTGRYHRLRQFEPGRGPFRTIEFTEGIKAVITPE